MPDTQPSYALVFDFGGTKLASGLVDLASGNLVEIERQATPAEQGAEASLQAMIQAGQRMLAALPGQVSPLALKGIGISFGGPVSQDRKRVLHSHHVADWDSYPLVEQVSQVFGLPTYMDNDANVAALGEWYFGAGRGTEDMVYIQVSTGVGGGLILGKQLYRGQGMAGEFGHTTVMPGGPLCTCGRYGCVESLTGGWALARDGKEAYPKAAENSPLKKLGLANPQAMSAELVLNACRQGDPLAAQIVERAFLYLGIGMCNAIQLFDPQMVVIGGGISRAWDVMYPQLQASMAVHLPPLFQHRTRIEVSALHGTETLLGAALLTLGY